MLVACAAAACADDEVGACPASIEITEVVEGATMADFVGHDVAGAGIDIPLDCDDPRVTCTDDAIFVDAGPVRDVSLTVFCPRDGRSVPTQRFDATTCPGTTCAVDELCHRAHLIATVPPCD